MTFASLEATVKEAIWPLIDHFEAAAVGDRSRFRTKPTLEEAAGMAPTTPAVAARSRLLYKAAGGLPADPLPAAN